jgi:hypothetical protein
MRNHKPREILETHSKVPREILETHKAYILFFRMLHGAIVTTRLKTPGDSSIEET